MSDPEDHAIDVTIEALTGTVYDLCVSPFETILGIKLKIQRLEGQPASYQNLAAPAHTSGYLKRDIKLQV